MTNEEYKLVSQEPIPQKPNPAEFNIIRPERNIYEHETLQNNIQHVLQKTVVFILEKVGYPETGGIFLYFRGCKYPAKGFPNPEAAHVNNIMKRVTMFFIMSLINPSSLGAIIGFALTPWKWKKKTIANFLYNYNRFADSIMVPYYLKDIRLSNTTREILKFVQNFLIALGFDQELAYRTGRVFAHQIEYDDAYRYRLVDVLSETSKAALLDNPQREFKKLARIFQERDDAYTGSKFIKFISLISYLLYLPKFEKAFNAALHYSAFENLQYDDIDSYFVTLRADYKFKGKPIEDRLKEWSDIHEGKIPPQMEVTFN